MRVTIASQGPQAWLVIRYQENGTYFRIGHRGGAYVVEHVNAHAQAAMPAPVETLANVMPAAGDVVEVRQAADGTVECRINGVLALRFVDPVTGRRTTLNGLAAAGDAKTVHGDEHRELSSLLEFQIESLSAIHSSKNGGICDARPLKLGSRLSRNAATPSLPSARPA